MLVAEEKDSGLHTDLLVRYQGSVIEASVSIALCLVPPSDYGISSMPVQM